MFDTLYTTYRDIISCIGIIGYNESDIISNKDSSKKNLQLNCLYAYPNKESAGLNPFVYEMMFPDNNFKIPCPKFFMLKLTNQTGQSSYLYCLKFSENYQISDHKDNNDIIIEVPLVIFIRSEKEDLECFKQLLNIINYIIINEDLIEKKENNNIDININDFKKVQLLNIFYFLISLLKAPPHSLVKLNLENEINIDAIESIDFYFSSNCEIPCNKNDTDINILFLVLDQAIILKVLFSILTEKQIVFRASEAYLLHIIIPSFLKLIFPFKWNQSCIIVLPKEKLNFLEAIGSFIFGVLSDTISLNDLMREYPNIIIVDIDTNEIFGDSYYEPYLPPNINNLDKGGIFQGNNFVNVEGSFLYKYEKGEKHGNNKKKKINFDKKENIIIDSQKCQMLVDRTNIFVNNNERKWLRKNIQLIRNPEIFDLENMNSNQKKNNKIYLNDEDEIVILPNRPFSYNIQNIFMIYILNKLSNKDSEFMSIFKKTNLYLGYNDQKKYQNNSGMKISENIIELKMKNKQRNIENCFTIEYHLQNFKTQKILKIINSKLKKEEHDETLENLQKIFQNYRKMKNEDDSILNELGEYYKDIPGRRSDVKKNFDRFTKIWVKKSQRTNSFLLSESNSNNNYNFLLEGVDKSSEGEFKFYKKNGFINFIQNFENFLQKENLNINDELYNNKIYEQILDIIIRDESIFNQNKEIVERLSKFEKGQNNISNNKENIERNNENENIVKIDSRTRSVESEFNPLYSDMELNQFLYSENILEFIPDFSEDKNNFELYNKEENINLRAQYYLYIATFLEKLMESKEKTDEFINKIKLKKNLNELNIKSLIVKLYRRAYNCSGKEHLDFPYFSYYIFLKNIELIELKSLNDEFTYIESDETELYEIYENVIKEKELVLAKLEEKRKKRIEKEKIKEEGKLLKKESVKNKNEIKIENNKGNNKSSKLQDLFNFFENKLFEKKIVKNNDTLKRIKSINQNPDFNYFITYYINNEPDFHLKNNQGQIFIEENLIQDISKEILSILPSKKEVNIKINDEVIIAANKKLIENKKLFELIGLLKFYSPEKLQSCQQRICFWANCFNFLILFTIFYKKWIINSKDDWKYFFQNVIYTIGGRKYSFNDMQYILFKRPLFFPSSYKSNDDLKKLRIDKADDFKNIEKKFPLINCPFIIYLPTKEFLRPIILFENELENEINKRVAEFLNKYIYVDELNNIILPELLTNYSTRFLYKEYKKYQQYLGGNLYNLIKDKKYKKNINSNLEFKLDFDNLLEY